MKGLLIILALLVLTISVLTGFVKCRIDKEIYGKEVELTLVAIDPAWRAGIGEIFKLTWRDREGTEISTFKQDTAGIKIGITRLNIDRMWQ